MKTRIILGCLFIAIISALKISSLSAAPMLQEDQAVAAQVQQAPAAPTGYFCAVCPSPAPRLTKCNECVDKSKVGDEATCQSCCASLCAGEGKPVVKLCQESCKGVPWHKP